MKSAKRFESSLGKTFPQIEARMINLPAELGWVNKSCPSALGWDSGFGVGFRWPTLTLLTGLYHTEQ